MAKLIWSPTALSDLKGICDFIGLDSQRYSTLFAERIVALIETIPSQPLLGAVVPEYDRSNLRERAYRGYRIIYRVQDDHVEIVAIRHGARLLPETPP